MSHDCNDCIGALEYWNVLLKDNKIQEYALVTYYIGTELHVDVFHYEGFSEDTWARLHEHGKD